MGLGAFSFLVIQDTERDFGYCLFPLGEEERQGDDTERTAFGFRLPFGEDSGERGKKCVHEGDFGAVFFHRREVKPGMEMPFDLERIQRACLESGLTLIDYLWIKWGGPVRDMVIEIHPLLIEPLFYWGRRRLYEILQTGDWWVIPEKFYDLTYDQALSFSGGLAKLHETLYGLDMTYYRKGAALRKWIIEAGLPFRSDTGEA